MPPRNYALDLLRGLTIALMIVVNNPGDWKEMFSLLRHAEWHGFLGADIVFPLFLFVAGFAAALKIARRQATGPHCASALTLEEQKVPSFYLPLLRRAATLFAIGLFLNAWPFGLLPGSEFSPEKLRVFGVLQRIAICVLAGGLILYWFKSWRGIVGAMVLMALAYEAGMRLGAGGSFALENNFARLVDTSILPAGMLYKVRNIPFDPEGLFTSLTAVMTFLLGGLAFRLANYRVVSAVVLAGLGAGFLFIEPINKNLWTLPYVFLTGSFAVFALTLLESLDAARINRVLFPIADMGRNPLPIYVLSVIVAKTLALWKLYPAMSIKQYLVGGLMSLPVPPHWLSLLYSLLLLAVVMIITHYASLIRIGALTLSVRRIEH